jgi:hypothetical protein
MQSKLIPIGTMAVLAASAVAFAAETPGQSRAGGAAAETISIEGRIVPLRHYLIHGAEGAMGGASGIQNRAQARLGQRGQPALDQVSPQAQSAETDVQEQARAASAAGDLESQARSDVRAVQSQAQSTPRDVQSAAQDLAQDVSAVAQQSAAAVAETLDEKTMKELAGVARGREDQPDDPQGVQRTGQERSRVGQRSGEFPSDPRGTGLGLGRSRPMAGQARVGTPLVLIPKEGAATAAAASGAEPYLLIFDPAQVTSLSALARGEAEPAYDTGAEADRELVRQTTDSQTQTDTPDQPRSEQRSVFDTARRTAEQTESSPADVRPERLRQRFGADAALTRTWRHDNEVRVTGRVLDRDGLRAIYVARVEKIQPESTATEADPGSGTQPER